MKFVLICLSALFLPADGCVACQLMYWFMKSYSIQEVPPEPFGSSDGVPTSKMPHPHAHAQLKPGVNDIIMTIAAIRRSIERLLFMDLSRRSDILPPRQN